MKKQNQNGKKVNQIHFGNLKKFGVESGKDQGGEKKEEEIE